MMLAVYTILGVEENGWTSAETLCLGAVSIALVAGFVLRQARIEKPLMPLRLFHSRNVSGANIVMALLVVGMFGIFFLGALYLQLVLGYEPLEVGLAFLPGSLLMGVLSLGFTDKLNMRFGPRNVLIAGLGLLVVAMLLFARTPVDGNYLVDVFPTMIIFGAGAGVAVPRPDDARDVGRHAERCRSRLRTREHHRPGGRRDRPRSAGDDLDRAYAEPARRRRIDRGGPHRRLPRRVPDRGSARSRGDRDGGDGAALGEPGGDGRAHGRRSEGVARESPQGRRAYSDAGSEARPELTRPPCGGRVLRL